MGKTCKPLPVKLIVGMISGHPPLLKKIQNVLRKKWGPADLVSPVWDFNQTPYYEREMGPGLKRLFCCFERLIPAQQLTEIKIFTNALEQKYTDSRSQRTINIDPGYLTLSKLTLATTKNYSHRLYVSRGIFEEVTLYFQDGTFQGWPWTYPDFKSKSHLELFNRAREIYRQQIEKRYGLSQLSRCL